MPVCAICGLETESLITETRRSGPNLTPETWPYCPQCWQATQTNGADPVILQVAYLRFWQFVYLKHAEKRGTKFSLNLKA